MISQWEVCVCVRIQDRWQIRNNLQLPEGCGQAQGAAYRGKQAISHGAVPTDQNTLFVRKSIRTGSSITVGARRI